MNIESFIGCSCLLLNTSVPIGCEEGSQNWRIDNRFELDLVIPPRCQAQLIKIPHGKPVKAGF